MNWHEAIQAIRKGGVVRKLHHGCYYGDRNGVFVFSSEPDLSNHTECSLGSDLFNPGCCFELCKTAPEPSRLDRAIEECVSSVRQCSVSDKERSDRECLTEFAAALEEKIRASIAEDK